MIVAARQYQIISVDRLLRSKSKTTRIFMSWPLAILLLNFKAFVKESALGIGCSIESIVYYAKPIPIVPR